MMIVSLTLFHIGWFSFTVFGLRFIFEKIKQNVIKFEGQWFSGF